MAEINKVRDLVKRVVRERLAEKVGVINMAYQEEEIHVTVGRVGRRGSACRDLRSHSSPKGITNDKPKVGRYLKTKYVCHPRTPLV